jgi:hypothetical protein
MQKVVGSNPISRFRKGPHLQAFFVGAVGWCVCVLRTETGPAAKAPWIRLEEHGCLQGILDRSNC